MIELRGGVRLATEARDRFLVDPRARGDEDLHRHLGVRRLVPRHPKGAHPPEARGAHEACTSRRASSAPGASSLESELCEACAKKRGSFATRRSPSTIVQSVERLSRRVQRRTAQLFLGVGALGIGPPSPLRRRKDSSPAEIVAARELFRQGTEDADAGRFSEGLAKFKRVAAVKETAAVRFNIARCEESRQNRGSPWPTFRAGGA